MYKEKEILEEEFLVAACAIMSRFLHGDDTVWLEPSFVEFSRKYKEFFESSIENDRLHRTIVQRTDLTNGME